MERRTFIQKSLIGAGALAIPLPSYSSQKSKKLCVLHTNDMHSRIEPFPDDGSTFANLGGMARRATLIQEIRRKESNVILLDAGDIFQGTPYFNLYGGELEFKLMSQMAYDAATLGNHDFDNGLEGLKKQLPHASFPFICSNYDFSETPLKNHFLPYKVFDKARIKVGVFGLGIELEGLVPSVSFGATKYLDPINVAKDMVTTLQQLNCQIIICLSHLGYSYKSQKIDDQKLAAKVGGIDLIIGGHTHTFLDSPTEVKNPSGGITLVNQAGRSGVRMGRIDFEFDRNKKIKKANAEGLAIK
ncbi:bifunctional metallophosphatase/5'-nucleotidase [Pleomorphovibrio marinus]|uniref:bifunctional metallophosphatase/5'-nucleotidase n=1 Tax=Pleomorphovibrio marinus TaxID=2164132 RepID=UPI000E0CBD42|nr:metallophosphoesterase [Pleomorphovibrio marinus]